MNFVSGWFYGLISLSLPRNTTQALRAGQAEVLRAATEAWKAEREEMAAHFDKLLEEER